MGLARELSMGRSRRSATITAGSVDIAALRRYLLANSPDLENFAATLQRARMHAKTLRPDEGVIYLEASRRYAQLAGGTPVAGGSA